MALYMGKFQVDEGMKTNFKWKVIRTEKGTRAAI
jgi:hypothetical protein